jgi:hypothetical protein
MKLLYRVVLRVIPTTTSCDRATLGVDRMDFIRQSRGLPGRHNAKTFDQNWLDYYKIPDQGDYSYTKPFRLSLTPRLIRSCLPQQQQRWRLNHPQPHYQHPSLRKGSTRSRNLIVKKKSGHGNLGKWREPFAFLRNWALLMVEAGTSA